LDGAVDAFDLQICMNTALGVMPHAKVDVNGDGEVNTIDIQLVINNILER
jgi:hypothetical protein